jgi:hypothetical protein
VLDAGRLPGSNLFDVLLQTADAIYRSFAAATWFLLLLGFTVQARGGDVLIDLRGSHVIDEEWRIPINQARHDGPAEDSTESIYRQAASARDPAQFVAMPLEFKVQAITPLHPNVRQEFDVELQLRNVGAAPVSIPAFTQGAEVLASPDSGRVRMGLSLRVLQEGEPLDQPRPAFRFVLLGAAIGSPSVANSVVVLQPNDVAIIRTRASLSELLFQSDRPLRSTIMQGGTLKLQAIFKEEFISGGALQPTGPPLRIERRSAEVMSVPVDLQVAPVP